MKTRDKTHDVCVARGKAFNQQILRASLLACLLALVSGCAARTKHASADYVNSAFDRELAPPATHASATPDAADLAALNGQVQSDFETFVVDFFRQVVTALAL